MGQAIKECTEVELKREIKRRARLRGAGLCDYCARPPQEAPCKFPSRHNWRPR